jgi:hypothetical protein
MSATQVKVHYLISEVKNVVKNAYHEWYVGTTNRGDVWRKKPAEMIIFNVIDDEATRAAYKQLVDMGMVGRRPIGREPYYLYLHRVDGGTLPSGFIH